MDTEYWEQQEKRARELKEEQARQSESYKKLEKDYLVQRGMVTVQALLLEQSEAELKKQAERIAALEKERDQLRAELDDLILQWAAQWGESEHFKDLFKRANALKRKYFDWYTSAAERIIALRVYGKIEIVERLRARVKEVEAERDAARQSRKRLVFAVRIERDFAEIGAEFAKTAEQALKICETQRDDAQADARELAKVCERNVRDYKKVNFVLRDSGIHGFDLAVKESELALAEHGAKYLEQSPGGEVGK